EVHARLFEDALAREELSEVEARLEAIGIRAQRALVGDSGITLLARALVEPRARDPVVGAIGLQRVRLRERVRRARPLPEALVRAGERAIHHRRRLEERTLSQRVHQLLVATEATEQLRPRAQRVRVVGHDPEERGVALGGLGVAAGLFEQAPEGR